MRGINQPSLFIKGSILVEFAIVTPLFLLLLFGIIEFGSLLFNRQLMAQVAFNAASKASSDPTATNTSMEAYLGQQIAQFGLKVQTTSITPGLEDLAQGSEITVSITATGDQLSWYSSFPIDITAKEFTVYSSAIKAN